MKRLEMQIPQENNYTGLEIIQKEDYGLEEFLNRKFEFPSDNLEDIKNFINEDKELEKIIYGLPEIVSKEFSESPISLDFTEYSTSDEDVMEIVIQNQVILEVYHMKFKQDLLKKKSIFIVKLINCHTLMIKLLDNYGFI